MPTAYSIYEIQLQVDETGAPSSVAGGTVFVAVAGDAAKATIYDADTLLAASNPLTPVRGKIRFATLATVASVDLFGIDGAGRTFVRKGVKPGADTEIYLSESAHQMLVIPFSRTDAAAATEIDTGFDLPVDAIVMSQGMAVDVLTAEASRTIEVGLLASETAGDADGFLDAVSLATAGMTNWAVSGTPTLGALLTQNFATTPAVNVPRQHTIVGSNAKSITYTLSASTASAEGFIYIPFVRPVTN